MSAAPEAMQQSTGLVGKLHIHVVVEKGAKIEPLLKQLPKDAQISAYFINPKDADQSSAAYTTCTNSIAELVPENSDTFGDVVERAERLSNAILDVLDGILQDTRTQSKLANFRHAFFLEWRASLITRVRDLAVYLAAARVQPWDRLIMLCRSEQTAKALLPTLKQRFSANRVSAVVGEKLFTDAPALQDEIPQEGHTDLNADDLKAIDELLGSIPCLSLPQDDAEYLVFVTRWGLKTIPPTLLPIIQELGTQSKLLILNRNAAGITASDIQVQLNNGENLRDVGYLYESSDFKGGIRFTDKALLRRLISSIATNLETVANLDYQEVDIRPLAIDSLPSLLGVIMPGLLAQIGSFERFFKDRNGGGVVVCPGRTSEAAIVQECAKQRSIPSIDLMNAYMSHGYTYTKPLGDYVTAIDSWSKELLVSRFKIPEERVLLLGTPRFDQVPLAPEQPKRQSGPPTVVIATQPSVREHMCQIIRALAELDRHGRVRFLVKMHPREAAEDEAAYREAAASANSQHKFDFVREQDIYDAMAGADAVVVFFSNVGVEAAMMGLPVVVAKLDSGPMPLPLDEFKIGVTATSAEELRSQVGDILFDASYQAKVEAIRQAYCASNPALEGRESTKAIRTAIKDLISGALPAS